MSRSTLKKELIFKKDSEDMDDLSLDDIKDITFQSLLQLIPHAGGAAATAYFGKKQAIQFNRLKRFVDQLAEDINKIKNSIAPLESHDIEGLWTLFENISNYVETEHSPVKIEYLKNFMKTLLIYPVDDCNYDTRKVFIDILGKSSELECTLLTLLYKNKSNRIKVGEIQILNVDPYAIVGAMTRLKSYGFIKTFQEGLSLRTTERENSFAEHVSISDYGNKFVEFCLIS